MAGDAKQKHRAAVSALVMRVANACETAADFERVMANLRR